MPAPRKRSTRSTSSLAAAVSRRLTGALEGRPVAEVAKAAGCSPATARRYLSGAGVPTVDFVIAVCAAYDLSAQWLLTGKGRTRRFGRPRRS
jgi:transcriptional regulator with XRE-family HTH domain